MEFVIGYLVYSAIAMTIIYRFQVAWRYMMHKKFYIKDIHNEKVKPLSLGDWMFVWFSLIPPVFAGFLICSLAAPLAFKFDAEDYFWGFFNAEVGQNYHDD